MVKHLIIGKTYVTEYKGTIFIFTLKPSIMSIVFDSLKHLKLLIGIIIPIVIPQIIYIWVTAT